jgi:hypothetical protein
MTEPSEAVDHLAEYRRLLAELDDLIDSGRGESDEAEVIRDRMDPHWYGMTPDQLAEFTDWRPKSTDQ